MSENGSMPVVQSQEEMQSLLQQLEGGKINALQVLGFNTLKTVTPSLEALAGERIEATRVDGRFLTVTTENHQAEFDLQRTGKIVWLTDATVYAVASGQPRPTVRVVLSDGTGLDLTEPAKTKRITLTLTTR